MRLGHNIQMYFYCIACFRPSSADKNFLGREGTNCRWCKATARDRAMLLSIHVEFIKKLFSKPGKFPQIVGVSDGYLMERKLSRIYGSNYQNYQYHMKPMLDITKVPVEQYNSADIVSCTDVLEHVAPPIDLAFSGLRNLLKPDGTLILSVPHSDLRGVHIEHFPLMKSYEIDLDGTPKLTGVLHNGDKVEFNDLVFHGGDGTTLEFRIFSQKSLLDDLLAACFNDVRINKNIKSLGIFWEGWSRVWIVK